MRYLIIVAAILTFFILFDQRVAWPHEWGPLEGKLKNNSSTVQLCLWDNLEGKLCGKWVSPQEWCRGDAMTYRYGVFKVPNKTRWSCFDWGCEAWDLYSYLRFEGARLKNGFDKYGEMSMEKFKEVMWDWSIDLCE